MTDAWDLSYFIDGFGIFVQDYWWIFVLLIIFAIWVIKTM